ncbi:MAG: CcmD family protein [Actinomycetota bacterium]
MKGGLGFLALAYALVWAGIVGYLMWLGSRQRALERRIRGLRGGPGE